MILKIYYITLLVFFNLNQKANLTMLKIKAKSYLIIYIAKRLVYFRSDFESFSDIDTYVIISRKCRLN